MGIQSMRDLILQKARVGRMVINESVKSKKEEMRK
jgi:hypothetical protein